MRSLLIVLMAIAISSCQKEKKQVDTVVFNANVYTVTEAFDTVEAFAVRDGKFVAIGSAADIQRALQ